VVKERAMELLILVLALIALDIAAQLYGADSRARERRP
jgi:hypothetical protein